MDLRFPLFVSGFNQGNEGRSESKIPFCHARVAGVSLQSFRERGGVI